MSRPKPKIGIYTKCPIEMSIWSVILKTYDFHVIQFDDAVKAANESSDGHIRCMLIIRTDQHDNSKQLSFQIFESTHSDRTKVVFVDRISSTPEAPADIFLDGKQATPGQIIEAVKTMKNRATGPKKLNSSAERSVQLAESLRAMA